MLPPPPPPPQMLTFTPRNRHLPIFSGFQHVFYALNPAPEPHIWLFLMESCQEAYPLDPTPGPLSNWFAFRWESGASYVRRNMSQ